MNKTELAAVISENAGISKAAATEAINAALDAIQATVARGEKVDLPGFGAFEMVHKEARTGRNPSTGAEIQIAESWAPKFKPYTGFKALVNEGGRSSLVSA
jgi:DNA-binding protein HU-beta